MKRYLRITAFALFAVLFAACARHKIIPDDKLAQIFHDAFLTNAYIGSEGVKTITRVSCPPRLFRKTISSPVRTLRRSSR